METASSSSLSAGYLARLIFCSIFDGVVAAAEPTRLIDRLNIKSLHARHHLRRVLRSPSKQLITVGRYAVPCGARLIVLVTRSGIEASRFSPIDASFMNVEMMRRCDRSSRHMRSTVSTPDQPAATIRPLSSVQRASVKTVDTGTSRSAGASMNCCTDAISAL